MYPGSVELCSITYTGMVLLMQIPEPVAAKRSTIWHDATEGSMDFPFEVEDIKEAVEILFNNESKSLDFTTHGKSAKKVCIFI